MAGSTSMIGGMVRVDPVFAPAPLRGRGYAGAATVEVSRAALTAGATNVVLFADPTYPTSNALYQRIGYVHVADFTGYNLFGHHHPQPARRVDMAGVFAHPKQIVLETYDRIVGLILTDIAVDGCITKAPGGGECAGRSPVDRGRQGMKRSTVVDG
jgi:hypothetical protein